MSSALSLYLVQRPPLDGIIRYCAILTTYLGSNEEKFREAKGRLLVSVIVKYEEVEVE